VIGVTARALKLGRGCVLYNVVDDSDSGIVLEDGQVLVGVVGDDGKQMLVRSTTSTDGGTSWKTAVEGNSHSFEQLHAANADADILKIDELRRTMHQALMEKI